MKRQRHFFRAAAVLATSLAAFGPGAMANAEKETKKQRRPPERGSAPPAANRGSDPPKAGAGSPKKADAAPAAAKPKPLESALTSMLGPAENSADWIVPSGGKFPWKTKIVTTTFWIGENAAPNNPVPNHASSWDPNWATNYGGTDAPKREQRAGFLPAAFVPNQNPFYVALPYNDLTLKGHKREVAGLVPWFNDAYQGPTKSVLKGRWLAIRFRDRIAYAQWEDCGPFRTDHAAYVFGTERPKPNLNRGAGLDVSPAVRDYLGMNDTDVTDWRFVDFDEVPHGPWSTHGENNTFVLREREKAAPVVLQQSIAPTARP